MPEAEPARLLEISQLSKSFAGLRALDDVDFTLDSGEIVALVGHNGSGKSTLIKVLANVHQPDPGARIRLAGAGADAATSMHFIHQDLGLVEMLSTVENLDLDRRHGWRSLLPVDGEAERNRARQVVARFGGTFDVDAPIADLAAAERAIVAIARALASWTHDRNILLLDEPTAALHDDEVGKLIEAVRRVAADGAGVVFISHRLDEVLELADRIVVLRDGRVVANVVAAEVDHDALVVMITGSDTIRTVARSEGRVGDVVFRARGIHGATVHGVDLELRRGEIVGVSGVLGSGRDQLAGILVGATSGSVDSVSVDGHEFAGLTPRSAIKAGIAHVPADRHRLGGVMTICARENLTLPLLSPLRRRLGRLDIATERAEVRERMDAVGVVPAQPERILGQFSGGNQQKIVLAKWLRTEPQVILLDEPTQGVDVGASVAILDLVASAAAAGAGVLIASSDDKELAAICDRVLVMRDGRIAAEISGTDLTEGRLVREGLHRAETAHTDMDRADLASPDLEGHHP